MNNILAVNGQPILVNGQVVSVGDTGYGGSGFELTELFNCGNPQETKHISLQEGILTFPTYKMWSGFLVQYTVSSSEIYYFAAMNLNRISENWYAMYCNSSKYGMLATNVITHSNYPSSATGPAYSYLWSWNLADSTGVANIYDGTDLSKLIIYGIS